MTVLTELESENGDQIERPAQKKVLERMVSSVSDLSLCFDTISDRKEAGFILVHGLRRVLVYHV